MPDAHVGAAPSPIRQPHAGAAPVRVNGVDLWADPSGALWWPAQRLLAVADLHLEKGSCYAARGKLLPPYDTAATLARLADAIDRVRPDCVICLGDSFHDVTGPDRLSPGDAERLRALVAATRWIWVAGNHDPTPPDRLGGEASGDLSIGPLTFRHAPQRGALGEIAGHLHPKLRVTLRARNLSGRCFVGDGHRLVLPAFGAYAGGLDIGAPAIRGLMRGQMVARLLVRDRAITVPFRR